MRNVRFCMKTKDGLWLRGRGTARETDEEGKRRTDRLSAAASTEPASVNESWLINHQTQTLSHPPASWGEHWFQQGENRENHWSLSHRWSHSNTRSDHSACTHTPATSFPVFPHQPTSDLCEGVDRFKTFSSLWPCVICFLPPAEELRETRAQPNFLYVTLYKPHLQKRYEVF